MKTTWWMVLLILAGIAGCGQPTTDAGAKKVRETASRATLSHSELNSQVRNYDGSTVILVGKVQKFGTARGTMKDGPQLWVGPASDGAVLCIFPRSAEEKLERLKIGETVRVKGMVEEVMNRPAMKNCSLDETR